MGPFCYSSLYDVVFSGHYYCSVVEEFPAEFLQISWAVKSLKPCSFPGHHAESNAPWTSRLVIITSPLFS